MRVALVHDWLITYRGGEKVLEVMAELYPQADIFTLLHERGAMPERLESRRITASWLDRVPLSRRRHRHLLPLMPLAVQSLSLAGYDLVISSSHCAAKGVRVPPGARHVSYVHAPMRYMWDRFEEYFGPERASLGVRWAARGLRPLLQAWDVASSRGVHRFVANSHFIATRIAQLYGRQASVVHPPVELERFTQVPLEGGGRGRYFLWLGALAPYKRVDLAIEAFRGRSEELWIAGAGQDARRVMGALPPNVRYLGHVSDAELAGLYHQARALVFTGAEDFGLTPLEAQACGRPVIAYAAGGALETVTAETGRFFSPQTVEALGAVLDGFEAFEASFDPAAARANAQRFSRAEFSRAFAREVERVRGVD